MTTKWGCKPWGTPWGDPVFDLQSVGLPNQPPRALLTWEVRDEGDYVFAVYVDGEFYGTTREQQMVVAPGHDGRFYFDVFALQPNSETVADSLDGCIDATRRGDRIKLTWTRPSGLWGSTMWGTAGTWGGESDTGSFNIYWDEGVGTSPLVLLETVTSGATFDSIAEVYEYTTDALDDGTYEFRVDPVDIAGNELSPSALTVTHVHDPPPKPPSDFVVTGFASGPSEFTATWTASPSSDVVSYRVYDNGGSGEVDYNTIVATIAAPSTGATWVRAGAVDGRWTIALRAVDATGEEENVDVRDDFDLDAGVVLGKQPAVPVNPIATPKAGGTFLLTAEYPAEAEESVGTTIYWYNNGGIAGDPIDFTTIVASASIDSHVLQDPVLFATSVTTGALTNGSPYKWAAKAADGVGRLSDASVETPLKRADDEPPADHLTLIAATVV